MDLAAAPVPKPYLYAEELAALTPWSLDEIDAKVKRGTLRPGVHYFQPNGRRGRRIFKWAAIVELIEMGSGGAGTPAIQAPATSNGKEVISVEEATERLRRLCG